MESKGKRFELVPFTQTTLRQKMTTREGETKIGERLITFEGLETKKDAIRYVLLGINEDIGPQANYGKPGSLGAFDVFLDYFANIQSNELLEGNSVFVLGQVNQLYSHQSIEASRLMVEELDDFIFDILNQYVPQNAIPIVIGGGHNNAYPLIKWASTVQEKKINVINLDPHADLRPLEGRHSGNSFSYALHRGYIQKYHVVGLHQSYNSQYILDELKKYECMYSFFEDYIKGTSYREDLERFYQSVHKEVYGIELDLDAIENMPTSAITPSGVSIQQSRRYIYKMGADENVLYFHLPEAAPVDKLKYMVGKTLGYFVSDFIKANASTTND